MLTEQEKQEITAELAHCATKQSASIEALNIMQRHRGWVSDEDLKDVAGILEMTPDELDAVATFYSFIFRKPVGRHVILVCDSISCWVMGYNPLLDASEDESRHSLSVKQPKTSVSPCSPSPASAPATAPRP